VLWRPKARFVRQADKPLRRMIRLPPELRKKLPADTDAPRRAIGDKPAASLPPDDEDKDGRTRHLIWTRTRTDEDLVVFYRQGRPPVRWRRFMRSSKPYLKNYKKILTFVGLGVLVETLFNVFMAAEPENFLIDDALGEEDFQALYVILGVLAARRHLHLDRRGLVRTVGMRGLRRRSLQGRAGLICSEHVPEFAGGLFCPHQARRKFSRVFSIDLSGPSRDRSRVFANSAALPFLELIAGIILMLVS